MTAEVGDFGIVKREDQQSEELKLAWFEVAVEFVTVPHHLPPYKDYSCDKPLVHHVNSAPSAFNLSQSGMTQR